MCYYNFGDVMKIIICRHGDPDYSIDSLTPVGREEAELLSQRISKMDVTQFYVSPLGRAKDTAAYTLEKTGKTAVKLDWLHEFKGVVRRGLKYESCWDKLPSYWTEIEDYYSYDSWQNTKLMKSGNVKKEYKKVCDGIDALLSEYGYVHNGRHFDVVNSNHSTIVLFCHFAVEAVILSHIMSVSPMPLWHNFVALPTSVTTLVTEEREKGIATFRCMEFGDTSHLYAGGREPSFAARFCECFDDDTRH